MDKGGLFIEGLSHGVRSLTSQSTILLEFLENSSRLKGLACSKSPLHIVIHAQGYFRWNA